MTIYATVKEAILEEYRNGMSQPKIATKYRLSQEQVARICSDEFTCATLTLGCVQNMFPDATIDLHGGRIEISSVPSEEEIARHEAYEQFRKDAIAEIARLDLPAETLKTVLQTLLLVPLNFRPTYE